MTINYCCWTSGNDTTGDGTAGNPYKTITKASTGLSGGDEVRVSKSPAHTALAGTLSFTDGSTSVGTSTDLTAALAANDLIGKDADDGMWYEIASLNSTTITLRYKYSGTTNASATAYKMGFHDYGSPESSSTAIQTISASGTSDAVPLTISGGWDLSTSTKTARSYFCVTKATRDGVGLYSTGKNYVEVSDLIMARCNLGFNCATLISFDACEVYANNTSDAFAVMAGAKNCKCCGAGRVGFCFYSNSVGTNIRCDSMIATSTYTSVEAESRGAIIDGLTLRNNGATPLNILATNYVTNIVAENNGGSINNSYSYNTTPTRIGKLTSVNNPRAIYSGGAVPIIVGTLIVSGSTTEDIGFSTTYSDDVRDPIITVQRWNDTQGDSRMFYENGTVYRNTAEARSGACINADPTSATHYINISLGKYLVTSVASDLTLSIYAKDNAAFNGDVKLFALMNNALVSGPTAKTMDTSYGAHTLVVDTDDLVENEWLELIAMVRGTAGNVYFDDFSVS